jgi:hypothetical protein
VGGSATSLNAFSLGPGSSATAQSAIAFGTTSNCAHTNSIAFGHSITTTATNQLVIGTFTSAYLGGNTTSGSPNSLVTFQSTGGSGTNVTGTAILWQPGTPTGNAATNAYFAINTPIVGSSGASAQTQVERIRFKQAQNSGAGECAFNDGAANYDLRVEGQTDANLLITDASADAIGVGISAPSAKLHVTQLTLGKEVFRAESVATNDDPNFRIFQQRAATTDATITTLHSITIPSSTTVLLTARVVARRTGGAAGTAEDGAAYVITGAFKNVAGTATQIGTTSVVSSFEDQAGWGCVFDVTAATARVRITGAINNNITWHSTVMMQNVGS